MNIPQPVSARVRLAGVVVLLAASATAVLLRDPAARPLTASQAAPVQPAVGPSAAERPGAIRITGKTHPLVYVPPETTYFGGTVWAPDSGRWEAIEGGTWTFDSGVGSAIIDSGGVYPGVDPMKPVGFHATMEGWLGVDASRSLFAPIRRLASSDPRWQGSPCVGAAAGLGGTTSFWCGVFEGEADSLCYEAGRGYGNNWRNCIGRPFTTTGGNLGLAYDLAWASEQDYDFTTIEIDTTGTGSFQNADVVAAAAYDGGGARRDTLVLHPGLEVRSGSGDVEIRFCFTSDGSWSDEDGYWPTACGAFAVDNVRVSGGGISYFTDFEGDDGGWSVTISPPLGDLSRLVDVADLPPISGGITGCSVQDSVLVFFDPDTEGHPLDQENYAVSPWIDLGRAGLAGVPGKTVLLDAYMDLELLNYVFADVRVQWDSGCLTDPPNINQFVSNGSFFMTNIPTCFGSGHPLAVDVSSLIPPGTRQIRIAVGVVNTCGEQGNCLGLSNTSPWFDNIRLAVHAFTTIQAAIDSAAPGDTVWIPPGTYKGKGNRDLTFRGKNLVLKSTGGAGVTILNCQGLGHGFIFESGEDTSSVVEGFTIRSGNANADPMTDRRRGGGIYASGADPTIRNCVIESCTAEYGGGIYGSSSMVTLDSCTVTQCHAGNSGGIMCLGGLIMTDCIVSANTAGNAAGIYAYDVQINRCDITDNVATGSNGGLIVAGLVEDSRILRNQAGAGGGGVSGYTSGQWGSCSTVILRRCLIEGNTATYAGGVGPDCFTLDSCTVTNNVGGGVEGGRGVLVTDCSITGNEGGGVHLSSWGTTSPTVSRCLISGNTAEKGGGLSIETFCGDSGVLAVTDCIITGNIAVRGGGVYASQGCPPGDTVSVAGCTIASNTSKTGGAAHISGAAVQFANTILWGNCADSTAAGIFLADTASVAILTCSDLDSTGIDGPGAVTYDGDQVFQDPLLCTPAVCAAAPTTAGVYTLALGSPCLPGASPCGTLIGALGQGCDVVPVRLLAFTAGWEQARAVLRWTVTDDADLAGFHVYRGPETNRERITDVLLTGTAQYTFRDDDAPRDGADYWLAAVGRAGDTAWFGPASLPAFTVSAGLYLAPNRPNPFAAATHIAYRTAVPGHVVLTVHDLAGREVARLVDAVLPAGDHTADWDGTTRFGSRAPAGVYLTSLRTRSGSRSRKLLKLE